jgi:hypothetical protein
MSAKKRACALSRIASLAPAQGQGLRAILTSTRTFFWPGLREEASRTIPCQPSSSSNVATFRKIGVKQSLRQMILLFSLLCPPEHAMTGHRVWCHQNAIVMKLDAKTPSNRSHIVIHGLRTFPTPELARTISFRSIPSDGIPGFN